MTDKINSNFELENKFSSSKLLLIYSTLWLKSDVVHLPSAHMIVYGRNWPIHDVSL